MVKFGAMQNAILTSARLAVMATDANGIIQLFNLGAERMLGYSAVEVVNIFTAADIHDPPELVLRARALSRELATEIAPDFAALACKASSGVEDCYESTLIRKNRERVRVAVAITVARDDIGGILGYLFIVTDISVRPQVGFEAYEVPFPAQQARFAKSDLLTRMSHEMRTPLSAILGFAQLMESARPPATDSQKKSITRILQAGWDLEKLIKMTSDLALIESGTSSLSLEPVPLAAAMLECQAMLEAKAQTRGIRVNFPRFESPCFVSADRNRLPEVLGHLLSAAIEYSELHAVIAVDCETHGAEWMRITIHDSGSGSTVERLTRSAATPEAGAGIGVLLAQRLVELMGGTIVEGNDVTRKGFSFDLKRVPIPMGAVRTSPHPAFGEATMQCFRDIGGQQC
jgi:signal transduction histidine kinase